MFTEKKIQSVMQSIIMLVGQSPGFLGCGFSGIPFTAEYNAIEDIKLNDHHKTGLKYQTEQSANNLYDIFKYIANIKKKTVSSISNRIVITNAFQCIPSDATLKALSDDPKILKGMAENCKCFLKEQIGIVNPQAIFCLGDDAWRMVANLYQIFDNNLVKKVPN